tara:strand:+ start:248 stop:499 length:252 start_codon:yes stop_codon:yes gene_type:complete
VTRKRKRKILFIITTHLKKKNAGYFLIVINIDKKWKVNVTELEYLEDILNELDEQNHIILSVFTNKNDKCIIVSKKITKSIKS